MSTWDERDSDRPDRRSMPEQNAPARPLQRPVIVATLYVATMVLGISVFVGLVLAYIWRADESAESWEQSHYSYLIRTFWVSLAAMALLFVGMILGARSIAIVVLLLGGFAIFIWFYVRSILSLVAAAGRTPMPRPDTWMF